MLTWQRGHRTLRLSLAPWAAVTGIAVAGLALVAAVGSVALVLTSDEVATAFRDREIRTVAAYEQRIAGLRRELDRLTSRDQAERQELAEEVSSLLDRQRLIETRYSRMEPLLATARAVGVSATSDPAETAPPLPASASAFGPVETRTDPFAGFELRLENGARNWSSELALPPEAPPPDDEMAVLKGVEQEVAKIESLQIDEIADLARVAESRSVAIGAVLREAGLDLPLPDQNAQGGPFIPAMSGDPFADEADRLSEALLALRTSREVAETLPLGTPVVGGRLTSRFGIRTDPFIRRRALHAGVDYASATGTEVSSAARGTVVAAGWDGGYGLSVVIDHGAGHTTRYAHLSRVGVAAGEDVAGGQTIGAVGSTGRSTGPHLHYEVRRNDVAVDPARFLEAGRRLSALGAL